MQFFCVCFGQWAILLGMLSIQEACSLGFAMAQAALFLTVACDPFCSMDTPMGLCLFSPSFANARVHLPQADEAARTVVLKWQS